MKREIAEGSPRPNTEMLYIGFLIEDEMVNAIREIAFARQLSFSAAARELLEEALTRPGLRVVR